MAWVAGADVSTGDLITAATWNNYLGAAGSIEYLKAETDKLDDVSHAEPVRALDQIYQNSTKIRLVLIDVSLSNGVLETVSIRVENATPPTIVIALPYHDTNSGMEQKASTFIVPPSYYYTAVIVAGTPTLIDWHEWDLH